MKTRLLILVVVIALVAAGAWFALGRGGAAEALLLFGTVEARDVRVGSLLGGRVLAVRVDEGATVAAGDTLVVLEPDLIELQLGEQTAAVDLARAGLVRAQTGPRSEQVERARIESDAAETERRRQEALLAGGSVGQREYDNALVNAKVAREAYLELSRGTRAEEIAQARAQLAREEGRLAYLRRQRDEAAILAPSAGVVQSLDLRPGDLVAAGQPVARLLEAGQVWVRVFVPEPSLGLVSVGQRARVSVDTFPGREFDGRVVEIRDRAEYLPRNVQTLDQRSEQVFGVKVVVDEALDLKPGMAAAVVILDASGEPIREPKL
ncbi:MAG: HlyD family secretion protein [bacterium]